MNADGTAARLLLGDALNDGWSPDGSTAATGA